MNDSKCLVSARDHQLFFEEIDPKPPAPAWSGFERRKGLADRRANAHDRRWEASRGRRFRAGDRRRRRG
jgi:hypothetical protein